jgi:hypothetical protein
MNILYYFSIFMGLDGILSLTRLQGIYYLIHAIHNALIVWSTLGDIVETYTEFDNLEEKVPNTYAASLVFALHFYHIVRYYNKLRPDDWLHHGTMIFLALPIGIYVPAGTLLGYSLFFTTGLPGGIDYLLLFGVRNGWLDRLLEKKVNRWLNIWIRSPGCVSMATATILHMAQSGNSVWIKGLSLIPAALNYWNGQYFMDQVVVDWARQMFHEHSV